MNDTPTETKDFFVSYNGADQGWAEWIAWALEEAGYSTVIQAWDFRAGGNFVLLMHEAARTTRRTLFVLSPNYLGAEYTHPEWAAAFAKDPQGVERLLIPVRVGTCQPEGLLAPIIWIDLVGLAEKEARQKLIAELKERAKPASRPPFPGERAEAKPSFPVAAEQSAVHTAELASKAPPAEPSEDGREEGEPAPRSTLERRRALFPLRAMPEYLR